MGSENKGVSRIVQRSNYYPFGLAFETRQLNSTTSYNKNDYLYNGKELQTDLVNKVSLDWYDYGARMYDAQLGRWHVMDPISEYAYELTPYRYAQNNPIRISDPDGLDDFFDINGNYVSSTKFGSDIYISNNDQKRKLTEFKYNSDNVANRAMLSNVATYYSQQAGGGNVSVIDVDPNKVGNAFAAYSPKSNQYMIAVDKETGNLNEQAGDKYNMKNSFVHEKVHEDKPESRTAFGETVAILGQVNDDSFYDTSSSFQQAIGAYAAISLNSALSSGEIDSEQAQKTVNDLNASNLGMFVSLSYDKKNNSIQFQLLLDEVKIVK